MGEFINNALLKWCQNEGITFTRSRPYHKNDNCHVEHSHVRNFVGYGRFSSAEKWNIGNMESLLSRSG